MIQLVMLSLVRGTWLIGAAFLSVGAQVDAALADGTSEGAPSTRGNAPDEVVLKDGSLYRGTLSQRTAESVEILLISGDLKVFPVADVAYAGPVRANGDDDESQVRQRPGPEDDSPGRGNVRGEEATLSMRAPTDGVTFHRRTGSAQGVGWGGWNGNGIGGAGLVAISAKTYAEICTAPCETTMPPGTYTLALSVPDGMPVEAAPVAVPPGDWTLEGRYESYAGTRVAGLVVGFSSLLIGGGLMGLGLLSKKDGATPATLVASGAGIMVVGGVVGVVLLTVQDEAEIELAQHAPQDPRAWGLRFAASL